MGSEQEVSSVAKKEKASCCPSCKTPYPPRYRKCKLCGQRRFDADGKPSRYNGSYALHARDLIDRAETEKYFAENTEPKISYILPSEWSLFYIMMGKEWQEFRQRVKSFNPEWEQCLSCPGRCRADSCDEVWEYNNGVKHLVTARFICRGCHWLKTPNWRMETWEKIKRGIMPPATKPPHIISCLGFTQKTSR